MAKNIFSKFTGRGDNVMVQCWTSIKLSSRHVDISGAHLFSPRRGQYNEYTCNAVFFASPRSQISAHIIRSIRIGVVAPFFTRLWTTYDRNVRTLHNSISSCRGRLKFRRASCIVVLPNSDYVSVDLEVRSNPISRRSLVQPVSLLISVFELILLVGPLDGNADLRWGCWMIAAISSFT